jgi:hypothetical protein
VGEKKASARTDTCQLGGTVVEVRDGVATAISANVSVIDLILCLRSYLAAAQKHICEVARSET